MVVMLSGEGLSPQATTPPCPHSSCDDACQHDDYSPHDDDDDSCQRHGRPALRYPGLADSPIVRQKKRAGEACHRYHRQCC